MSTEILQYAKFHTLKDRYRHAVLLLSILGTFTMLNACSEPPSSDKHLTPSNSDLQSRDRRKTPPTPAPVPSLSTANGVLATIDPLSQPKFVNELRKPRVLSPNISNGYERYSLEMKQFQTDLGLLDPVTGARLRTTVWGYGETYPGPTIEAWSTLPENVEHKGRPVQVRWINGLPSNHILPIDPTIDCGPNAPGCSPMVRTVTHLHGGHTDSGSDGHPDAWFTRDYAQVGHTFDTGIRSLYTYRNDQQGASLWYHDHAMGITRLNVYAGLAGFYLLHDDNEQRLMSQAQLPDKEYDYPLLIQDKSFNADGSLAYSTGQAVSFDANGQHYPSVEPEFFGDTILVNGKIWPVLNVEPRKYRFRLLNGSNSRFLNMTLSMQNAAIYYIGSDGGLLDEAVRVSTILLGPAERADIIVDFADPALFGSTIVVTNDARSPYPFGDPVDPNSTGLIMAFNVNKPLNARKPDSVIPTQLRTNRIPTLVPTPGIPERELMLAEGTDNYGRLLPQLGTSSGGPMVWSDPVTETPLLGTTEVWKIINTTGDTHPVHQHLVQFRVLDRQRFDVDGYVPGQPSSLRLQGSTMKPEPIEAGWKDTVKARPGEVVRIVATYDLLGDYVWHCHILEHEDHSMMRPFRVVQ